jgi:predicted Rossmann-fold nucleotide-binding protein
MKLEVREDNLKQWLACAKDCRNLMFLAVDLSNYDEQLSALPQATSSEEGCLFFSCIIGPKLAGKVVANFGLVYPNISGLQFDPFRANLYDVETLLGGFSANDPEASYRRTVDRKIYESYMELDANGQPLKPVSKLKLVGPDVLVARRLHDHFITENLQRFLNTYSPLSSTKRGVVAIMGGHDVLRNDPSFLEIAKLSRDLTLREFLIVSGGGPGLMEAANLGAAFADHSEQELVSAVTSMASAPKYDHPDWMKQAWLVREQYLKNPSKGLSVGIPTWWYGHEPPNVFATHIAKYFENSLREEGLLAIATHGIVFGPGNAGTVQEIFQDATQNYYKTYGYASPMILYGSNFWDLQPKSDGSFDLKSKSAWQLLKNLARLGRFEELISLTDSREKAVSVIDSFRIPNQQG